MQSHDLEGPQADKSPQAGKGLVAGRQVEPEFHKALPPGPEAAGVARALDGEAPVASVARRLSAQPARLLPGLQRMLGNRVLQRVVALARQGDGPPAVDPDVEERIHRSRGGGQALDSTVRTQMEGAFRPANEPGPDFGGVRVHADGEADSLNRSVSARAFTTGQDIYFRQGAYSPGTSSGRELIAHELTHVVQQGGGSSQPAAARQPAGDGQPLTVSQPGDRFEQEAERMARGVAQQEVAAAPGGQAEAAGAVQRAEEEKKDEGLQAQAEPGALQRQGDDKKDEES